MFPMSQSTYMNNTLVFDPFATNAPFPYNLTVFWCFHLNSLDPFVPNALFVYLLKTSENLTVFWCFQGLQKGYIGNKWIDSFHINVPFPYLLKYQKTSGSKEGKYVKKATGVKKANIDLIWNKDIINANHSPLFHIIYH